jgi:ribonuclease HI
MAVKRKFYVVWNGVAPGIYDSWEECQLQIKGYPDARYKSYATLEEATEAYRGDPREQMGIFKAMSAHKHVVVNYSAFPEIRTDAIAVDAACSKNPGPVEYQGVMIATGEQVFHVGPVEGGTNNIGEYIAIIHAASLFARQGNFTTPIYSDSRTALAWIRNGRSRTTITPTANNARIINMLQRADAWLRANGPIKNPIYKWDTDNWGEIPADFGRK